MQTHHEKELIMRFRLLGNSGLRVSDLALGTMTFGDDWGWGAAKDEARKVYDAFRDAGGNFVDSANIYTNGTSESFLGEFMMDHRQGVVLATKYTNAHPGTDPNAAGNHRKSMVQAVEPTTSISTGSTSGTRSRLSKKSCADWMIWFAKARCSTLASRTPRPGGSRKRTRLPTCGDGRLSSDCRSNTA